MSIFSYNPSASLNTTLGGNSVAEGMQRDKVSDSIRQIMADIATDVVPMQKALIPDGTQRTVNSASGANADKRGENFLYLNSSTTGQFLARYVAAVKSGNLGDGSNDIGDNLVVRWQSISNGFGFGGARVISSPLNAGSGLPTAPAVPQSFGIVVAEDNPQNRHGDVPFESEVRRMVNWTGGVQMVAETQDFTAALGPNTRRGYNVSFGYLISRSFYSNDDQQKHATFNAGILCHPNSIYADGAFLFATGYRQYPVGIAISAAGTGYTVGDVLTFSTGLSQDANENTQVRVKTVNGSGAITAAEIYRSGAYQASFASPIAVTGGTGSGATFTYTMSSDADLPRAWGGMCGRWKYGIDAINWQGLASSAGQATFLGAMFRAPNNTKIIVARNAAGNNDVAVSKVNASDEVEIAQTGTRTRILGPLTAFPAASATPASNGEMEFELTSNTSLKVKVKGSDGTVRSVTLTLA